ncbi:hypothetical protein [Stappia sp. 28M-7]|jgi:hypothetical protein|uniref:hypothetical protein n=1 Tax=Hyphomicrobiales TaxID=356 RepID=UPI00163C98E8|nr:hypothetical protein [Stappia sp. 28M-7]MBC2861737.1 hypothetical protein [Stappia sp. 28M-7]
MNYEHIKESGEPKTMLRSVITAFGLLALAVPVMAAEPGGAASGTIAGEEIELSVWTEQSDFTSSSFSIYFRAPALRERGLGNLSLGAEWIGDLDGDFFSAEIDIPILDTDPYRIYRADLDDELSLTITSASDQGGVLAIAGQVEGVLTSMDRIALRNPDPDDTLSVSLTFEAVLSELQ